MEETNKFGVPHHEYTLVLENGNELTIDVGCEEDWGNVQECISDDCDDWETAVGWGNDDEGHVKIVSVVDNENGKQFSNIRKWAENRVWKYQDNYTC